MYPPLTAVGSGVVVRVGIAGYRLGCAPQGGLECSEIRLAQAWVRATSLMAPASQQGGGGGSYGRDGGVASQKLVVRGVRGRRVARGVACVLLRGESAGRVGHRAFRSCK